MHIRILHRSSGLLLAEGRQGWNMTPFEGNYYIRAGCLQTGHWKPNYMPGLCVYKGLYVGLDLHLPDGTLDRNLAWMYWAPNPLLPMIWFRVAVFGHEERLIIDRLREVRIVP